MNRTTMLLRTVLWCVLIAGLMAAPAAAVDPAPPDEFSPDASSPADKALTYFDCTPGSAATFRGRVHLRCTNGASVAPYTIYYWAVSTANEAEAGRAMSVFLTAVATAKPVRIYYDGTDTSGTAIGCNLTDCRLATGVELFP